MSKEKLEEVDEALKVLAQQGHAQSMFDTVCAQRDSALSTVAKLEADLATARRQVTYLRSQLEEAYNPKVEERKL